MSEQLVEALVEIESSLGQGSAFVPADSEAASHLHGVILRGRNQLDIVIAGLIEQQRAASRPSVPRNGDANG